MLSTPTAPAPSNLQESQLSGLFASIHSEEAADRKVLRYLRELAEYCEASDVQSFLEGVETSQISRETFLPFAIAQRTITRIGTLVNIAGRVEARYAELIRGPLYPS